MNFSWAHRTHVDIIHGKAEGPIKKDRLSKVLDEITYSFPNFSSATIEVWKWIRNFIPHFLPLSPNWARGVLSSPAGRAGRWAGGRALPHTVTTLPGAVLVGSWSNLVGTNLGAGSRTSSFVGDLVR